MDAALAEISSPRPLFHRLTHTPPPQIAPLWRAARVNAVGTRFLGVLPKSGEGGLTINVRWAFLSVRCRPPPLVSISR